ncbi:hypothetical protein CDAR_251361 [Caerostris darwini]|uniref:Uncharacterized protein n=1 Tax=Caerostris darwini TaxID=1538125 RepID=A0AAV4R5V3_9ARAC|nr:hypothetical protein CDAR_251361 [Caerostris darwini]
MTYALRGLGEIARKGSATAGDEWGVNRWEGSGVSDLPECHYTTTLGCGTGCCTDGHRAVVGGLFFSVINWEWGSLYSYCGWRFQFIKLIGKIWD